MRFEPGTAIDVVTTKWRDRPHWEYTGHYLGADEHGDWVGFPAGTGFARPGVSVEMPNDQVALVPAEGAEERGWLAGFHSPGGNVRLYVDMTTPPVWEGTVLRAVDLDLDVVEGLTGRVWVDDEDEFADHRVRFDYPPEVCEGALAAMRYVADATRDRRAPFDGLTHLPWLERLTEIGQ